LLVAALLVAIPTFVLTSLAFVVLAAVLHPERTVAAVLGLVWFIGSLVLIGSVLMRILRWLGGAWARALDRKQGPRLAARPL
jgi:uncharacterized membrane protein YgdD (TMEM256/DUF423 family)